LFVFTITMARGRPSGEIQIVDELLFILEDYNLVSLSLTLGDQRSTINWLAARKLIANSCECDTCHSSMTLNRYEEGTDGFRWYCSACKTRRTLRRGSFFTKSHLPLKTLVTLIYMWANQWPHTLILSELRLALQTIVDWRNFMRDVCVKWKQEKAPKLGGFTEEIEFKIVEIDESAFGKFNKH
jgi:transposase-like protein